MPTSQDPMTERKRKLEELKKRIAEARVKPQAFVNYFCFTFNPKEAPYHFPFKLFPFQDTLIDDIVEAIELGDDLFIEKCREMGATYVVVAVFLWFWLYVPGSNFLLGSRKQSMVDNRGEDSKDALSNKEESLFGKLDYMLSRLPKFLLPQGFKSAKHFTHMSLKNPENGNVISGESSNANFSRGGRYKAVLLDEFAFWDNDTAAWGATADSTNCRIVITTPGVKPGKAKRLRFGKDGEKIKIVTLSYSLDPRKNQAWLSKQRERRSAEDFAREIMINWESSVQGRVYVEISNAEIGTFPYVAAWSLYVTWDFGLDGIPIQWWMRNPDNGKMRLVDSYFNTDQPIQFFFPWFPGNLIESEFEYTSEELEQMEKTKHWKKAIHFGDPDVRKRSVVSKTKTSTKRELEGAGIYVQTKPGSNEFFVRREKTKLLLQKGIEVNDTPGNRIWMDAMTEARYPQRAENSQAVTAVMLPIHDWTSHHRTATEYLAVNLDGSITRGDNDPYAQYENYKQPDLKY